MSMSVTVWADRAQKATQSDAFDLFDLGIGCLDSYWQTSKHLSFWTGKKSPKKIQQTLRWTTTAWVRGASIKVPFSLCTWRRTILPSVGVQLLPWRVSWWRCVFCACFLFFLFSLLQKGMCFPTNDMGFPSRVGLKMPMLHQQEWQGGRAGSLMEAIFQQSLNVQKCPEVV